MTFRPPSGYYGQFGDKDSSYVDHKDFDNNSKNNEFSDPDADEMVLGDETLQSNITKQIRLLEEDDIDVDVFETPIALCTPPNHKGRNQRERQWTWKRLWKSYQSGIIWSKCKTIR